VTAQRLVFVNRFFFPDSSATSQLLYDLARHLAGQGFDVEVVTSRLAYGTSARVFAASERVDGVRITRIWTTAFGRTTFLRAIDYLSFYVFSFLRLVCCLRKNDIVVAKTDPPLISVVCAAACALKGADLVNWLQDVFPEIAQRLGVRIPAAGSRLLQRLRNWSLRHAAENVVIGENMAAYVGGQMQSHRAPRVIFNWADGRAIAPRDRNTNALRRDWGLERAFVVGYSGNMGRVHLVDPIVDAALLLRDRTDIHFLFIGDGSQARSLQDRCAALALRNVQFRSYVPRDQLGESLSVADVHIVSLAPDLEGLVVPSKAYGAMAAGRALIYLGDVEGEIARVVQQAPPCGIVVSAQNSQFLSQAIVALADDMARTIALGAEARSRFCAQFDAPIALARWLALLSTVGAHDARGASSAPTSAGRMVPKDELH
jgi:glycosyltransferase involved in cell wall biosynthesis